MVLRGQSLRLGGAALLIGAATLAVGALQARAGGGATPLSAEPRALSLATPNPSPVILPTLPAASPAPGSPPAPPELNVQSVVLTAPGGDTVRAGISVLIVATCEASRGADKYSVPHAGVAFSLAAPGSSSASVAPAHASTGDTGTASVSLDVGDVPGDIVVTATSGNATGQTTIHVTPDETPPSTASPSGSGGAASTRAGGGGGTTGGRAVAVALLIALGAAVIATTLVRVGLLPRLATRGPRDGGAPESPVSSS